MVVGGGGARVGDAQAAGAQASADAESTPAGDLRADPGVLDRAPGVRAGSHQQ